MFFHHDPQNRKKFRGPDFFLVLDVEDRERKSWVVWQERMRFPDVVIELLSDSTREVDKVEKKTRRHCMNACFTRESIIYMIRSHKNLLGIICKVRILII